MTSSRNWFPIQQAVFKTFVENFSAVLSSDAVAFGCSTSDATGLASKVSTFSTSFAVAEAPETNTPVTRAAMRIAKNNVIADLRRIYKKVKAANLPDDKLLELGLPLPDLDPSVIPPPGIQPLVAVASAKDRSVRLKILNSLTGKRGKPSGCSAYEIFSFVGENPPAEVGLWKFEGLGTRSDVVVTLTGTAAVAGGRAHFAVRYVNAKGQAGPVSDVVSTWIGGGLSEAA